MTDKILVKAARGEPVDRVPIWIMRQAGRYLPEYHDVKSKAGGFLGLCKKPEFGVEVALQPIRRFGLDAAILFSDILVPAEAMGIELDFNPGPLINNPVRTEADIDALRVPEPREALPHVLEIIKTLRLELDEHITLIGFAGAPFTVASYIVEDGSARGSFEKVRRLIYGEPELAHRLMAKIADMTIAYLKAQIEAGADIVQLFDSSAGQLPPKMYTEFALESARMVVLGLADTGVPIIYFAPGAMHALEEMRYLGVDVIGVDHRVDLRKARTRIGSGFAVQGNLDPAALLGTPAAVKRETKRVLDENERRDGYIFNLGHGILPSTPPENVEVMIEAIRESDEQ